MTSLTIPQYRATIAKIAKINARAAKRGLAGRLDVEAGEPHMVQIRERDGYMLPFPVYEERIEVELTGEAPRFAGWTFAARIDIQGYDEDGKPIFTLATAPGIEHLDRDGIDASVCEHCGTRRRRKNTYVLLGTSDEHAGRRVVVGSTCLKDFLGWEGHIAWLDTPDLDDEEWFGSIRGPETSYAVADILRLAIASTRMRGYVPGSAYGQTSTREHVGTVFLTRPTSAQRAAAEELSAAAAEVDPTEVTTMIETLTSEEFPGKSPSTYAENLKVLLAVTHIHASGLGTLVSAPQAYAKHLGIAADRAAREAGRAASEWIGTKGEKITVTLTVERLSQIVNHYGGQPTYSTLVSGRTEAGEIVKCFTAAAWVSDIEVGQQITLTATVKDHESYEGTKQTLVARPKPVA